MIIHSCDLLIFLSYVLTDDDSSSCSAFFKDSLFLLQDLSFMSICQRILNVKQHCCHLSDLQQIAFSENHFTKLSSGKSEFSNNSSTKVEQSLVQSEASVHCFIRATRAAVRYNTK
jgi:hypothetical protein